MMMALRVNEWWFVAPPHFRCAKKIQFNSSTCFCCCGCLSNLLVLCEESKTGVDSGRERSFFCWHYCCWGCLNVDKEVGWDFVAKMVSKYIPKKSAFTLCNEKTIYSSLVPPHPHPFAEEISCVVAWKLLLISFWLNTEDINWTPLFLPSVWLRDHGFCVLLFFSSCSSGPIVKYSSDLGDTNRW